MEFSNSSFESFTASSIFSHEEKSDLPTNPFNLQWSFGFNSKVPVLNLGTKNQSLIAYACSHFVVLYDYKSKEIFTLQGHSNCIENLSADQTGQWLLSSDKSVIIVWDTQRRISICTLCNAHGKASISTVSISPDAKYIVTAGDEELPLVKYWRFGENIPEAIKELSELKNKRTKGISFYGGNSEIISLTTENCVLFIEMDTSENKLIVHKPEVSRKFAKTDKINNTTFISESKKAFAGTTQGCVIMWIVGIDQYRQTRHIIEYVKCVPLQKANISIITNYDSMVVTGNSLGSIIFYDSDLKILYWFRSYYLDLIYSISFDLEFERQIDTENTSMDRGYINNSESQENNDNCEIIPSNITFKMEYHRTMADHSLKSKSREKLNEILVARDMTMQRNPLSVDRFIVATLDAKISWIDISRLEYRSIYNYSDSPFTALDVHPKNDFIILGNKSAKLYLFNHVNHELMICVQVMDVPDLSMILKSELIHCKKVIHISNVKIDREQLSYATVLKYSPQGDMLICGTSDGLMWVLNPSTLSTLDPIPYRHSETAILDIVFSDCSTFLAYYDDVYTVAVFKYKQNIRRVSSEYYDFIGKFRSHNAPIRGILFSQANSNCDKYLPRLLTLGEDRYFIEYDLLKSGPYPTPGLLILRKDLLYKTEIPLSMDWHLEKFIAISNSDYKIHLIDCNDRQVYSTFLGPILASPVKNMMIVHGDRQKYPGYMIFRTEKEIGFHLLPFDGNPYRSVGVLGHPTKISRIRISNCGRFIFTTGYDDQCSFKWTINYKFADSSYISGGTGLSPYHEFLDDGTKGFFLKEIRAYFNYAQILYQGENSRKARKIGHHVPIQQIPMLIYALGFRPTRIQLKNLMNEIEFRNNGKTVEKISFEEFVKYYINHKPVLRSNCQ